MSAAHHLRTYIDTFCQYTQLFYFLRLRQIEKPNPLAEYLPDPQRPLFPFAIKYPTSEPTNLRPSIATVRRTQEVADVSMRAAKRGNERVLLQSFKTYFELAQVYPSPDRSDTETSQILSESSSVSAPKSETRNANGSILKTLLPNYSIEHYLPKRTTALPLSSDLEERPPPAPPRQAKVECESEVDLLLSDTDTEGYVANAECRIKRIALTIQSLNSSLNPKSKQQPILPHSSVSRLQDSPSAEQERQTMSPPDLSSISMNTQGQPLLQIYTITGTQGISEPILPLEKDKSPVPVPESSAESKQVVLGEDISPPKNSTQVHANVTDFNTQPSPQAASVKHASCSPIRVDNESLGGKDDAVQLKCRPDKENEPPRSEMGVQTSENCVGNNEVNPHKCELKLAQTSCQRNKEQHDLQHNKLHISCNDAKQLWLQHRQPLEHQVPLSTHFFDTAPATSVTQDVLVKHSVSIAVSEPKTVDTKEGLNQGLLKEVPHTNSTLTTRAPSLADCIHEPGVQDKSAVDLGNTVLNIKVENAETTKAIQVAEVEAGRYRQTEDPEMTLHLPSLLPEFPESLQGLAEKGSQELQANVQTVPIPPLVPAFSRPAENKRIASSRLQNSLQTDSTLLEMPNNVHCNYNQAPREDQGNAESEARAVLRIQRAVRKYLKREKERPKTYRYKYVAEAEKEETAESQREYQALRCLRSSIGQRFTSTMHEASSLADSQDEFATSLSNIDLLEPNHSARNSSFPWRLRKDSLLTEDIDLEPATSRAERLEDCRSSCSFESATANR